MSISLLLKQRADTYNKIRSFFSKRGVLEVETPLLAGSGTVDPAIDSFEVSSRFQKSLQFLQTSPEFAMKRLLASGSGSIFQICKSFRDGERGRLHSPEFSMLEWYRCDFTYFDLMHEVDALVKETIPEKFSKKETQFISYKQVFIDYADIDPFTANIQQLKGCISKNQINISEELDGGKDHQEAHRDQWLDLILTHLVEPNLGKNRLTFVYDYPASQAALAALKPDNPEVAERFELYIDGVEIANGFQELQDPKEQEDRFIQEQKERELLGKPFIPYDKELISALEKGLPYCSGVALGLDRLLMFIIGVDNISGVNF